MNKYLKFILFILLLLAILCAVLYFFSPPASPNHELTEEQRSEAIAELKQVSKPLIDTQREQALEELRKALNN